MKEIALIVLSQILTMSVCMAFGYFVYKRGEFGDHAIRQMASLTMKYTIPLSIALSFREQFRTDRIRDWMTVFLFTSLAFLLIIGVMSLLASKKSPYYQQKRLCALIPNNAIFGVAIAQSLFGSEGIFLMSAHIVVSNILLWTYGIGIFSEKPKIKKIIFNPAVIGVLVGIALVYLPFEVPGVLVAALDKLTALNSPIGLMLAGSYIARIKLHECFVRRDNYWLMLMKLIVGPLLILPVLLLLHIDRTLALTVLIGLLAPTGTAAATFTEMAGINNTYSSSSVAFNQVACIITIPLMLTFLMKIF